MRKHKMSIACDIPHTIRKEVIDREDHICIICGRPWHIEIAHYISRAHGGLGIPQNLVCLCHECHQDYDNGNKRKEYGAMIRDYLRACYKNWDETKLVYDKYDWLPSEANDETE